MRTLSLILTFIFLAGHSSFALEEIPPPEDSPSAYEEFAQTLIEQTGTAISPVVGLSYLLLRGDPAVAQYKPWVWAVLVLFAAVILKDVGGTFVPAVLKKPLDALELFQNQGLGVVCAALIVPEMHQKLYTVVEMHAPVTQWAGTGGGQFFLAAAGTEGLLHVLTLPLSIVLFATVWLLSNTINALVLLSPFSLVDTCLKSIKVAGLALLAGLSAIHPYAGAALSLVIVVVAICLAGKAFRLYHFSVIFAWDLLTRKHTRFQPHPDHLLVFLDQEMADVPARTYGRLILDPATSEWRFTYRPWLVLPQATVAIPLDRKPKLGRGIVHATIEVAEHDGDLDTYFHLSPRYRGHEDAVGQRLQLEVVDIGLRRGFSIAWRWLKAAFRKKRPLVAVV